MSRFKRYFVRNDETGLIETWSMPYCIGDGHYAVTIDEILQEGFHEHGFTNKQKAKEFIKQVKEHYENKCHTNPKLSIIKAELKVELTEVN
jgi:hypothetical protein